MGILAYGTLLGGYLSEKWLAMPEPTDMDSLNWSLRKYLRFIHAAGGWQAFQVVLQALSVIAKKHNVPIAAVATRHVLDLPAVKAVIVGSRLSKESDKYTASNLAVFSFTLDEEDRRIISEAQEGLSDIPGDNGDEYRRAPFLTASGDLSHHLSESSRDAEIAKAVAEGKRIEYSSGSPWEPIAVSTSPFSGKKGKKTKTVINQLLVAELLPRRPYLKHHPSLRHDSEFSYIECSSNWWYFSTKPDRPCIGYHRACAESTWWFDGGCGKDEDYGAEAGGRGRD